MLENIENADMVRDVELILAGFRAPAVYWVTRMSMTCVFLRTCSDHVAALPLQEPLNLQSFLTFLSNLVVFCLIISCEEKLLKMLRILYVSFQLFVIFQEC